MKIENIKTTKRSLINFELLKSKAYKQHLYVRIKNFNSIETKFKKVLKIIHKYHINNKQIIFIGVPLKVRFSILKFLKVNIHEFISESTWVNGLLSNKTSIFKYIQNRIKQNSNCKLKTLILIKRKPKLIVLSNLQSDVVAFKEATKFRIPIIIINNNKILSSNLSYTVFTNFDVKISKPLLDTFYFLLISILKFSPNKRNLQNFYYKR